MVCLEFETFYPTNPQKPLWVKVYHEEINKLKPKKLPMNDIHLHEQFKKYFGYKKAIKCKVSFKNIMVLSFFRKINRFQASLSIVKFATIKGSGVNKNIHCPP